MDFTDVPGFVNDNLGSFGALHLVDDSVHYLALALGFMLLCSLWALVTVKKG